MIYYAQKNGLRKKGLFFMKKFLALMLAVLMCTALFAACANTGSDKDTASDSASNSYSDVSGTTSDTQKKKLIMATNAYFQPYEYYDGDKIVGIDAEIAAAIAEKLGMELEIQDMTFDSILTAVPNGTADFGMAGMTITDERKESVDFSTSYAKGVQVIIVKENSEIIKTDDDVYKEDATFKIGTQLGTTGFIYASASVEDNGFGEDRVIGYTTGNEAISALLNGDVECVIIDNEPAKAYVANNAGLKIMETSYADEDYAICVAKTNPELLQKIDTAIYELTKDGTIQKIIDKYIK